jgi:hypothetical protein
MDGPEQFLQNHQRQEGFSRRKGAVSFHFAVPICDMWENGKIYDIDSFRDYICGLRH